MAWKPKVRRHGTVYVQKTVTAPVVGSNNKYIKRRPVVITAIATDTAPVFRRGHGGETYGTGSVGVPKHVPASARTSKYRPG